MKSLDHNNNFSIDLLIFIFHLYVAFSIPCESLTNNIIIEAFKAFYIFS